MHIGLRKRDKTLYLDHLICRPKASDHENSEDEAADDEAPDDEATDDEATQDEALEDEAPEDQAPEDQAPEDQAAKDETSDNEAAQLFRSDTKNAVIDFASNRHERCKAKSGIKKGSRLKLGLLRTCRQVYQEAGLYIYAENTFSFGDAFYPIGNPFNPTWHFRAFDRFIESLTPRKRMNIRNIILTRHKPFTYFTPIFPAKLRNITSLRGLRDVTVMLEMLGPNHVAYIFAYQEYSDNFVSDISRFARSPWLRSLRICMYSPQHAVLRSTREWCTDQEKEILEGYQSIRRQERVKAQKEMQKQDEKMKQIAEETAKDAQNTQKREIRGLRTLKRKSYH